MNQEDFVGALDDLAGPTPRPTSAARAAVAGRVRRARRRIAAASSVLVVVIGVSGFGLVQSSALDSSSGGTDVAAGPGACRRIPPAVARSDVPRPVSSWTSGHPAVGAGSLWTARRVLTARGVHEGPVWRMKLAWFVVPLGPETPAPVLTAREVGGPRRATGEANRATDESGTWFASTIELTGSRTCWEITARHGDDMIRFRRRTGR